MTILVSECKLHINPTYSSPGCQVTSQQVKLPVYTGGLLVSDGR